MHPLILLDIWFQLRPEVLVSRYHSINDAANQRLRQRLGRAVEAENLQQKIIFGAGKRCAPNQVSSVLPLETFNYLRGFGNGRSIQLHATLSQRLHCLMICTVQTQIPSWAETNIPALNSAGSTVVT